MVLGVLWHTVHCAPEPLKHGDENNYRHCWQKQWQYLGIICLRWYFLHIMRSAPWLSKKWQWLGKLSWSWFYLKMSGWIWARCSSRIPVLGHFWSLEQFCQRSHSQTAMLQLLINACILSEFVKLLLFWRALVFCTPCPNTHVVLSLPLILYSMYLCKPLESTPRLKVAFIRKLFFHFSHRKPQL